MSTTYTGVAGNVSLSAAPQLTIPSDGDTLAVASVDVGLQKLTDFVDYFRQHLFTPLSCNATTAVPNTASTIYSLWAFGFSTAVPAVSGVGSVGTDFILPFACRIAFYSLTTGQTTAGGTTTLQVNQGGTRTTIASLPSGTGAGGPTSATVNVALSSGTDTKIEVSNGAGMTASIGTCQLLLFLAPT